MKVWDLLPLDDMIRLSQSWLDSSLQPSLPTLLGTNHTLVIAIESNLQQLILAKQNCPNWQGELKRVFIQQGILREVVYRQHRAIIAIIQSLSEIAESAEEEADFRKIATLLHRSGSQIRQPSASEEIEQIQMLLKAVTPEIESQLRSIPLPHGGKLHHLWQRWTKGAERFLASLQKRIELTTNLPDDEKHWEQARNAKNRWSSLVTCLESTLSVLSISSADHRFVWEPVLQASAHVQRTSLAEELVCKPIVQPIRQAACPLQTPAVLRAIWIMATDRLLLLTYLLEIVGFFTASCCLAYQRSAKSLPGGGFD
jgi:hypothetical protein